MLALSLRPWESMVFRRARCRLFAPRAIAGRLANGKETNWTPRPTSQSRRARQPSHCQRARAWHRLTAACGRRAVPQHAGLRRQADIAAFSEALQRQVECWRIQPRITEIADPIVGFQPATSVLPAVSSANPDPFPLRKRSLASSGKPRAIFRVQLIDWRRTVVLLLRPTAIRLVDDIRRPSTNAGTFAAPRS